MRAPTPLVLLVVAIGGTCSMTVELGAVRLLAPWFGTSSAVWTHVIGVVLLALAIGYLLGARLSSGADPLRRLAVVLGASGLLCAWLPGLSGPVSRAFLPEGLLLEEAGQVLRWGSLAAAACLFLPAAAMLGCAAPLAVEVLQRARASSTSSAGSSGGLVLCASTLGSLAGTFATTYWCVPVLGLSATFLAAGGALVACGVVLAILGPRARAGVHVALVGATIAAGFLSRSTLPDAAPGTRRLETRETRYQSARVVESGSGADVERFLQVNESFDSFQSVWQAAPGFLPDGHYYNVFALPALFTARKGPWRLLVLGLGGGTTWRVLDGVLPSDVQLESTGVEIDPGVVELATRWMDLPRGDPLHRVVADVDARAVLDWMPEGRDQIVLDAYQNQIEIPAQLSSVEFFRACAQRLAPGGWISVNVGAFGLGDPVLEAVGRTVAAAFARPVLAVRVPFSRNAVLLARREAVPPEPGTAEWKSDSPRAARLLAAIALPGAWRWIAPEGPAPLTDDRNPIEALQRRAVLDAARSEVADG